MSNCCSPLPGIFGQAVFTIDGFIDDAVDVSFICPTDVERFDLNEAVDPSGDIFGGLTQRFDLYQAADGSGDICGGLTPRVELNQGTDLSITERISLQFHKIGNAAQVGDVICVAYLVGGVSGVIGTAVDLSGYEVGQLPLDVSALVGVIDFANDISAIEVTGSQLHNRGVGTERANICAATQQLFTLTHATDLPVIIDAPGSQLRQLQLAATGNNIVEATRVRKQKIDSGADTSGSIERVAILFG